MNKESIYIFDSERLLFREWMTDDQDFFAKMNSNPRGMEFFTKVLTRDESDQFLDRIQNHFDHHGFGLYAICLKSTHQLIGYIGFMIATFKAYFTPCIEIGWRIDEEYWGKGYATEGAKRVLEYGFNQLELEDVYSFTSKINKPSQRVMEKIGMSKIDEFQHPRIDEGHPLKTHVLYHINSKTEGG